MTSSLADWNAGPNPNVIVLGPDADAGLVRASSLPDLSYPEVDQAVAWTGQVASSSSLSAALIEPDIDRTPRSSEFPQNVQDTYVPSHAGSLSVTTEFQAHAVGQRVGENRTATSGLEAYDADFQAYAMGLAELGIEPVIYGTTLEEQVLSEFFNFDHQP